MSSCSAMNSMYGGKKSRSRRHRKSKMYGGRSDGSMLDEASEAITGTALGTVQVVKEGVSDAGSSMLNKLGSIFSSTGEKLKESGSKLYDAVVSDDSGNSEFTGLLSGGRRRRRHKSVKSKRSRSRSGGRKHRVRKTRRQSRSRKSRSRRSRRSRSSRRH